ncbi:hypothetical protein D1007_58755 [Hordeum vulgare]|nr:hypothetical protein D1007_58755 [Hordeum vulgare]
MAGHGRKKAASPSQVMQGPGVQAPRWFQETNPDASSSKDDDEEGEIMKRLPWTSEEDDRLVSAWLKNSNDSIGDVANLGKAEDHEAADSDDIPRPPGTKTAKRDGNGNDKRKVKSEDLEELQKFLEAQKEATKSRTDVLEVQKRIAADKLESSRLILLAAKENKEAKTRGEMVEQYGKLLTQDMGGMTDF